MASWRGLMHAWRFTSADTVLQLGWGVGAPWAAGYLTMAVLTLLAAVQQRRRR
jgi:AGZA family xanthine/uracil permease-like MFS transporter